MDGITYFFQLVIVFQQSFEIQRRKYPIVKDLLKQTLVVLNFKLWFQRMTQGCGARM